MMRALLPCLVLFLFGVCADKGPALGRRRAVPVIYVQGSHYEVGFDVGRTFSALIKDFISSYENLRTFEKEYKSEAGRDVYDKTLSNMKRRYPYYVKEMQGIADGAQVPFHQLFLLQLDDIIGTINENTVTRNDTGGCSSIAFHTNNKHTYLGHTEDAFSETLNHFYIMSAHIIPTPEDKEAGAVEERFASLCYAGHLPGYTMGYNGNGLVFSINTLSPQILKPGATPRTFITRALLASKNFQDAERILLNEGLGIANGFSLNMIWSTNKSREIHNVEVAPDLKLDRSQLHVQKYYNDTLVHCNIYQRLNTKEVIGPIVDSSEARLQAIRAHARPSALDGLKDILSDQSGRGFQVFSEKPENVIQTIAAGIFDLEKLTWSIYINRPNTSEPVAILPIRFTHVN